jgi:hypothetical protein
LGGCEIKESETRERGEGIIKGTAEEGGRERERNGKQRRIRIGRQIIRRTRRRRKR